MLPSMTTNTSGVAILKMLRASGQTTYMAFGLTALATMWSCLSAAECIACHTRLGEYYCKTCRLWDDQPGRGIYHCPFCNLCRRGQGLGIDACHCMKCNTCMHLSEFKQHTCRELSECPICKERLFNSNQPFRVSHKLHFLSDILLEILLLP